MLSDVDLLWIQMHIHLSRLASVTEIKLNDTLLLGPELCICFSPYKAHTVLAFEN